MYETNVYTATTNYTNVYTFDYIIIYYIHIYTILYYLSICVYNRYRPCPQDGVSRLIRYDIRVGEVRLVYRLVGHVYTTYSCVYTLL